MRQLPKPPKVHIQCLEQVHWWADVHPNAVAVFERGWLVSTNLFGLAR